MILVWSTTHEDEYFDLGQYADNCKKCGENDYVIEKDVARVKLFYFIPIMKFTNYFLCCKNCGKKKNISKKVALELIANIKSAEGEVKEGTTSTEEDDMFPDYSENNTTENK